MLMFGRPMYLRPGNLYKEFDIRRLEVEMVSGFPKESYVDNGERLIGILAEASSNESEKMKHRWDQSQHSLTHTLVTNGKSGVKKGDQLILGERGFLALIVDDVSALGMSDFIYLEERNDVK